MRSYLKERLGLRYKILRPISSNYNKEASKLQRQYAASKFIELLHSGKTIINIDETVVNSTDNRKRGWTSTTRENMVTPTRRIPSVNLFAAASSRGEVFFTINKGKTNSITFLHFLSKLVAFLSARDFDWRATTVLLIDNAPYHRSQKLRTWLEQAKLPMMFLGPYQFRMAPAEHLFSFMKNRSLNSLSVLLQRR